MPRYEVHITQTSTQGSFVEVEADNPKQARERAEEMVFVENLEWDFIKCAGRKFKVRRTTPTPANPDEQVTNAT